MRRRLAALGMAGTGLCACSLLVSVDGLSDGAGAPETGTSDALAESASNDAEGVDSRTDAAADALDAKDGGSMTFFVTSAGNGAAGGNYGGIGGADGRCQQLAAAVGRGSKTWHAYLSVAAAPVVNARDRIGTGPWFNHDGALIASSVVALHANPPKGALMLTETGQLPPLSEHDILTGSKPDGTAETGAAATFSCQSWTSSANASQGWVGHVDWDTITTGAASWNSAHGSECDQAGLASHSGAARLYCFAID